MRSEMTEEEFKRKVRTASATLTYDEVAAQVAREAGLEFAPEPVPAQLEVRVTGAGVFLGPEGGDLFQGAAHMQASLELARDRYNAYPGLREAADGLCRRLRECHGGGCETHGFLGRLEAELAKGPK